MSYQPEDLSISMVTASMNHGKECILLGYCGRSLDMAMMTFGFIRALNRVRKGG